MKKNIPFALDHVSIAQSNRDRALNLLSGLGFSTGDTYKARTVHYILENTYFEVCTYLEGQTISWLGNTVPATNLPKVHSYRLSVKGTDPNPIRNSLIAAGIEEIGEINQPFTQFVRYGDDFGMATYQTFFIKNFEPFTDVLFGATTHLNKELIVGSKTNFTHPNGAKRVTHLAFYCDSEEKFKLAEMNANKLFEAVKDTTDTGRNLDTIQLLDKEGYLEEFGVEPPIDRYFPAVAIGFSGCYLPYLEEKAFDMDLKYFYRDGKFYIDLRRNLGMFFIFCN